MDYVTNPEMRAALEKKIFELCPEIEKAWKEAPAAQMTRYLSILCSCAKTESVDEKWKMIMDTGREYGLFSY